MTKRFNQAYNAVVKAYFNGTLQSGNSCACFIGNMIADACGAKYDYNRFGDLNTDKDCNFWYCDYGVWVDKRIKLLVGYSMKEILKIEKAFEGNCETSHITNEQEILEQQYNGLCAAVDVLLELDGLKDNGHKAKFKEHPKYESSNHKSIY